jgi:hypothetical protein
VLECVCSVDIPLLGHLTISANVNAPAMRQHPGARSQEVQAPMTCTLYRIEDDATTTFISEHDSIVDGVAAGRHMVEVKDFDFAYALHTDDDVRVSTFAEGRVGYREWARRSGRLDYIHSLDDKYDHDVDMALS